MISQNNEANYDNLDIKELNSLFHYYRHLLDELYGEYAASRKNQNHRQNISRLREEAILFCLDLLELRGKKYNRGIELEVMQWTGI